MVATRSSPRSSGSARFSALSLPSSAWKYTAEPSAAKDKAKKEEKKDENELKLPPAEAIEIQLALPRAQQAPGARRLQTPGARTCRCCIS